MKPTAVESKDVKKQQNEVEDNSLNFGGVAVEYEQEDEDLEEDLVIGEEIKDDEQEPEMEPGEGEEMEGEFDDEDDGQVTSTNDGQKIARNQCHICLSQFPLEKTYVEHMYNVHGVQRPFRCQDCGKCLSYRSSLYNHRKIHSNKRPWICQWCPAKFIWSNSLKYHVQRAHQQEFQRDPSLAGLRSRRLQAFHVTKTNKGESTVVAANIPAVGPQSRQLPKPNSGSTPPASGRSTTTTTSSGRKATSPRCNTIGDIGSGPLAGPNGVDSSSSLTNGGANNRRKRTTGSSPVVGGIKTCPICSKRFGTDGALSAHLETCLVNNPQVEEQLFGSTSSNSMVKQEPMSTNTRSAKQARFSHNNNSNSNWHDLPDTSPFENSASTSSPRYRSLNNNNNNSGFVKSPTSATELLALLQQQADKSNTNIEAKLASLLASATNSSQSNAHNSRDADTERGQGGSVGPSMSALSVTARLDLLHARQETLIRRVESLEQNISDRIGKIEQILVAAFAQQLMQQSNNN